MSKFFSIQTWFQNIPSRRIKAEALRLGGMKSEYAKFYKVLLGMKNEKFKKEYGKYKKVSKKTLK